MNKKLLKDTLGWGFLLWLIGYILGIILFMVVPHSMVGWIIMPVGIVITLWVLLKRIKAGSVRYYSFLAISWMAIAIVFDYLFLVKMFKSEGYYKLDVYLYYLLMFALPLIAGWCKNRKKN